VPRRQSMSVRQRSCARSCADPSSGPLLALYVVVVRSARSSSLSSLT
jgi:hypothetical protein